MSVEFLLAPYHIAAVICLSRELKTKRKIWEALDYPDKASSYSHEPGGAHEAMTNLMTELLHADVVRITGNAPGGEAVYELTGSGKRVLRSIRDFQAMGGLDEDGRLVLGAAS